jgi:hypothetical protein
MSIFWNYLLAEVYYIELSLFKKLFNSYIEAHDHQERFDRFSDLQLKDVPDWERMVKTWEDDHDQPNPYTVTKSGKICRISQIYIGIYLPIYNRCH